MDLDILLAREGWEYDCCCPLLFFQLELLICRPRIQDIPVTRMILIYPDISFLHFLYFYRNLAFSMQDNCFRKLPWMLGYANNSREYLSI